MPGKLGEDHQGWWKDPLTYGVGSQDPSTESGHCLLLLLLPALGKPAGPSASTLGPLENIVSAKAKGVKENKFQKALPQIQKPHWGSSAFQPGPPWMYRSLAPGSHKKKRSDGALVCHLGKPSNARKPTVTGLGRQYQQKNQHPVIELAEHLPSQFHLISVTVLTKLLSAGRSSGAKPINWWSMKKHSYCFLSTNYLSRDSISQGWKKPIILFLSFYQHPSPPF